MDGGKAPESKRLLSRRRFLLIGTTTGFCIAGASLLAPGVGLVPRARLDAGNSPPRPGDLLTFAEGSMRGRVITVNDVPVAGPPVLAWPMDATTKAIRSGAHRNLVLLVRAASAVWFSASEFRHTVADIAAYSAVCTHLCCSVSGWASPAGDERGHLLCPCHQSMYDPWDGARVLSGPAPRPLPVLPLATSGRNLMVADRFLTDVGCSRA